MKSDYITTLRCHGSTKEVFDSCETTKMSDDKKLLLLSSLWLSRESMIELTKSTFPSLKVLIHSSGSDDEVKKAILKITEILAELQSAIRNPKLSKPKRSFSDYSFAEVMREVIKHKKEKQNE